MKCVAKDNENTTGKKTDAPAYSFILHNLCDLFSTDCPGPKI